METSFEYGLGIFVDINIYFCHEILFYLVSSIFQFLELLKSKSTQMLTPQKRKLESFA